MWQQHQMVPAARWNWLPWRNKPVLCRCRIPCKGPHEKWAWDSVISYTPMFLNLINNAERFCLNLHFTGSRKEATAAAVSSQEIQRKMSHKCVPTISFTLKEEALLGSQVRLASIQILWWSRTKQVIRDLGSGLDQLLNGKKSLGSKRTFFHSTHLLPSK